MSKVTKELNMEGVAIGFRNFEGREGIYNKAGDRSFSVFLEPDVAEALSADGWNVKFPKNSVDPENDTRRPHLQVAVSFENYPANVFLINNDAVTRISDGEVSMLDWAELSHVDLVIRPYTWSVNGRTGVKAYLKSGYFTIVTDAFADKYGL